jgi:hypothetical protein
MIKIKSTIRSKSLLRSFDAHDSALATFAHFS